jgi:hypothetical protein
MPGDKTRIHKASRQEAPRIAESQAARILEECDCITVSVWLSHLRRLGFGALLGLISQDVLQLALQPDSWGERMRALLMSDIAPALQGHVSGQLALSVDDIARCANIVMPCFLLELGRRSQHIQIEFPPDPTDSSARFKLSAGPSYPVHSINGQQLVRLASSVGEELVGLCYFGDQLSRETIEAELVSQHAA